jgi:hypothetical protein
MPDHSKISSEIDISKVEETQIDVLSFARGVKSRTAPLDDDIDAIEVRKGEELPQQDAGPLYAAIFQLWPQTLETSYQEALTTSRLVGCAFVLSTLVGDCAAQTVRSLKIGVTLGTEDYGWAAGIVVLLVVFVLGTASLAKFHLR